MVKDTGRVQLTRLGWAFKELTDQLETSNMGSLKGKSRRRGSLTNQGGFHRCSDPGTRRAMRDQSVGQSGIGCPRNMQSLSMPSLLLIMSVQPAAPDILYLVRSPGSPWYCQVTMIQLLFVEVEWVGVGGAWIDAVYAAFL